MKRTGVCLLAVMLAVGLFVTLFPAGLSMQANRSQTLQLNTYDPIASVLEVSIAAPKERPMHYAVVVGISDYKAIGDLRYCDEDANDWFAYLTDLGYDEIVVLGDETSPYTKYDGVATEFNVKLALMEMVSKAGPRDTIAFITSGHGSGDSRGGSLLCMWDITAGEDGEDGYFWDYELAPILELSIAANIFVFIDHCFAGGFGDDLMGMSNAENVYLAATCDVMGMGWDAGEYSNGMWTYFFLEYALIGVFDSDPHTEMEAAFLVAESVYPFPQGAHHPQAYDGDLDHSFFLW